ncbi:C cytochrome precursor [Stieleria sp. ICT_E10.1]|uniref:multiheme c-type cytochrome n=1 Tax=Stieleria sedimenti TaxID=2976331 RepID=UPI00217FB01E|nr:multiheme c-type cytochrome [Stieleria sedimenti]MCS7471661.1 C cytochrome precursor [Stieleria sedimenti]
MNEAVIGWSVVIGLVCGGLVWWIKRSIAAALTVPVVIVALVALALPPAVVPVAPPPDPLEPVTVPPEAQEDLPTAAKLAAFRPIEVSDHGYVASDACRECHPENHATWFASYHRTMTQVANPDVVLGDFNDVKLSHNGRDYQLREVDGVCWVELLDPAALPGTAAASQRVQRPIVMTTGSHHMQAYWFPIGVRRTLAILPFVFLNETQEWIPRSAAFLKPMSDGVSHEIGRWNSACSRCHSTHPQERELSFGEFDTHAAEFGISCEACHGPGQEHIAYHRDLAVDQATPTSLPSDPIVNPEDLSHVRSSQVCGQCHSVLTLKGDPSKINVEGTTFRPGSDLSESYDIWQLHSPEMRELLQNESIHDRVVNTNRGTFYPDGVVRVSGREYTSMEQSGCFQRGEMSCLSCHQLHKAADDTRSDKDWANDQLKPSAYGNDACVQCHDQQQYSTAHTHHLADSSGSNCYNCHMPHTAYGLLKAIRNHTISIPDLKQDLAADRPNACNQCHLDKTLKWTADYLKDWYSIDEPELDTEQSEIAASVLWLLKGDAANRAMAAWTMGWPDAQAASGSDWQSIFLAQVLNDPYLAIRMIARRSLQTLPELADLKVNVLGSDSERRDAILSILARWDQDSHAANPALLLGPENTVKTKRIDTLMQQRDDTPMTLSE